MPWFRFLKKKVDDPHGPISTSTVELVVPTEAPGTADELAAPADAAAEHTKKRRRGSRGGRNRKKPVSVETAEPVAEAAPTNGKRETASKSSSRSGTSSSGTRRRTGAPQQQRRRQPPRRAPLPAAKRELVISVDVGEQRVAILEDDRVAEVYLERPERRSIAGNIYLGTVDNVLPGMEAAFVEIGLEKNGFLYVDEIVVPELEGRRHGKKITDLIQRGQQILVQAVKDPMKTKGARLTTEISLPGRFLVYVPNGEGLGVSRRLEDAERQRLKEILKGIAPSDGGVIVRTAAEGASAEDVERDLVFLQRLWKTIQARAQAAKAPDLVYQEAELPLRIVRDLFAGDFEAAYVDNDRAYKRIVGYLKKTSPHMLERVHRDKEKEPLFERYGVERELASTLERRVDLPSGGYLIFDYAEAFTVIDVNTGRFVGSRSKTSTQRLEDTIVKNNLEAVKEVVRQLRLRDIGGIIVIDFIDMANPKNRQAVEEALRTELERDRTKTYVVEISPLGLVEMTRQNVTDGPREIMTRKCPTCDGDGIVVSDATTAMIVERRLRALAASGAGSRVQAYRIAVHPRTLWLLAGPGGERLAALEEATRRRFFLVPAEGHAHGDHFEVLAEGRLADLQPTSSLAEGAEVEVKLVEVGLHDPTAGVAKHDGVDVSVAGAAKLVGKRAVVRVGRILEGQAFATLAETAVAIDPITFESEAEKPTRAPSRRRVDPVSDEKAEGAADGHEPDAQLDDAIGVAEVVEITEGEVVDEDDTTGADTTDTTDTADPPKKKTRRGSRGGRKRKKKPVDGEAGEVGGVGAHEAAPEPMGDVADEQAVAKPEADAPERAGLADTPPRTPASRAKRTPKIHLPDAGAVTAPRAASHPSGGPETSDADPDPAGEPEGESGVAVADGESEGPGPARKRTRRGSRGGRNRKKKPALDEAPAEADAPVEAGEPPSSDRAEDPEGTPARQPRVPKSDPATEAPPSAETDGYVPMSEWIDDFERGRR